MSGTWRNFYTRNRGVGDKDFMHSLMLLFRRFRRGIHLPNVHNGGPALEGLQVSHPQNGISVSTPQFSTPLHLACVGIEKSALSLHLSLSTLPSTVSPPPSVPSLSSPLCLRRPLAGREINTCLPYWKFHQSWAKVSISNKSDPMFMGSALLPLCPCSYLSAH